jgi:UDP-N-acetylmuramate-alanine ligase
LYKTYPAREDLIEGGTAEDLFNAISSSDKLYFDNVEDLFDYIKNTESGYDCVLVLGAGDLAEKLKIKYHNYINYC